MFHIFTYYFFPVPLLVCSINLFRKLLLFTENEETPITKDHPSYLQEVCMS